MPLFNKKQLNILVSGSNSDAKAVLFSAGIRRSDGSPSASWGGFAVAVEALTDKTEALQLAQTALVIATESGSKRGQVKMANLVERIQNPKPASGKKAATPATPRFEFSFAKVETKTAAAKKPAAKKPTRRKPAAKAKAAPKADDNTATIAALQAQMAALAEAIAGLK